MERLQKRIVVFVGVVLALIFIFALPLVVSDVLSQRQGTANSNRQLACEWSCRPDTGRYWASQGGCVCIRNNKIISVNGTRS